MAFHAMREAIFRIDENLTKNTLHSNKITSKFYEKQKKLRFYPFKTINICARKQHYYDIIVVLYFYSYKIYDEYDITTFFAFYDSDGKLII